MPVAGLVIDTLRAVICIISVVDEPMCHAVIDHARVIVFMRTINKMNEVEIRGKNHDPEDKKT